MASRAPTGASRPPVREPWWQAPRPRRRRIALMAVVAATAVATPPEPWSTHARVVTWTAVAAIGVLAVVWGAHRRAEPAADPGPPARGRVVGYLVWLVLLAVFLVHQMSMFLEWPRNPYPTLSALWNILLEPSPVRGAAFAGWIGFGVFLVRRVPVGATASGPPAWRPR